MTAMLRFGLRRRYFPAPRSCNIAINLTTAAGHHFFTSTRRITGGYQFFVEDDLADPSVIGSGGSFTDTQNSCD